MKLRHYLLIANGISLGVILVCLFFSYYKMYLTLNQFIGLSAATVGAGILSFFVHFLLTRPVEKSIRRITEETARIAGGEFAGRVPEIGPTEFRILASRFNEMKGELEESFRRIRSEEEARKELVANVSHDLRTPMASIQSFVEALEDDVIQDEQTFRRYLQTIRLETARLSAMIDDLFQLSRLDAGAERLSRNGSTWTTFCWKFCNP